MAVVGARACWELTLATLLPIGLATRTYTARAGRMSRGEESRLAENGLASDHRRTNRLTPELSGGPNAKRLGRPLERIVRLSLTPDAAWRELTALEIGAACQLTMPMPADQAARKR